MKENKYVYCTDCVYGKDLIESIIFCTEEPSKCKSCNPLNPEDNKRLVDRPNYIGNDPNYVKSKPDYNEERISIYTITVFESLDEKYGIINSRCMGYYSNPWDADEDVRNNNLDIHEYLYKYAVIEKVREGLYPCCIKRWFYKWDDVDKLYEPIEEPECVKGFANFWNG